MAKKSQKIITSNPPDFTKPMEVPSITPFGPPNIWEYIPRYDEIPDEFKNNHKSKWERFINNWFFNGIPKGTGFAVKDGIDVNDALKHISCALRSWEPKHEHKTAGCAYLMYLWFDDVVNKDLESIL